MTAASGEYGVGVAAGSLRDTGPGTVQWAHRWTEGGVSVDAPFTGAHLLHAAVAGCVLNDLYREAVERAIALDGVRVTARGGFDAAWHSTGVTYTVELDSAAEVADLARLVEAVDEVAEIPSALRAGLTVRRGL
jgi:uncharacterized OsmC-like protein